MARVGLGAGSAAILDETGDVALLDLAPGSVTVVELETADGDRFDATMIVPDDDGPVAIADDTSVARWVDGRITELVGPDPGAPPLMLVRPRTDNVEDFDGAAAASRGSMVAYTRATDRVGAVHLVETAPGRLAYRLTIPGDLLSGYGGNSAITSHPAPDGGLHLVFERGRVRTYDAAGSSVGEVDTGLVGLTVIDVDDASGRLALGGDSGAVIVDPAVEGVDVLTGVGPVASLGFARDGEELVIVGTDGTVQLWDVGARESIGVVADAGGAPSAPPWYDATTDTVWVATSRSLLQIPLAPDRWIERACQVVPRDLTRDEWDRFVPGDQPLRRACP